VINNGRKKVNQLHSIISNRNIDLSTQRLLLLSVLRPSIEYGSEVGKCNKSQTSALQSILLGGANKILKKVSDKENHQLLLGCFHI